MQGSTVVASEGIADRGRGQVWWPVSPASSPPPFLVLLSIGLLTARTHRA